MDSTEFNLQELLDKVLTASKDFAERGKNYAEGALDIPEGGEERQHKLDGLKKGAITTAILVGLLGTKGGRSLTGKALKIGSVAALGTAAYKGYQSWRSSSDEVSPVHELEGEQAHDRAFLLIAAMVSAANADGNLDDNDSAILKREILGMKLPKKLFGDVSAIVEKPLSAKELSERVDGDATASEVYMATRMFIDDDASQAEISYLQDLVDGLGLDKELVSALDGELV